MELIPGISHEQLLSVARRIVGPDDAEDVVQTAYLKAHRSAGTFRSEARRSTWLYRITTRCAIDVLRRRKRRPEEALPVAPLAYVEHPRVLRDLAAEARRRMAALPAKERKALQAVTVHESYAAAAAALGITTQALKSRLNRARVRLRSRS